jgi:hypothetical protein
VEYIWIALAGLGGFALGYIAAWGKAGIEASKFIKEEGDRMEREFNVERDKRVAQLCDLTDMVLNGKDLPKPD